MTVKKTVADGLLNRDQGLGVMARRYAELVQRVSKGSRPLGPTLSVLQAALEGEYDAYRLRGPYIVHVEYFFGTEYPDAFPHPCWGFPMTWKNIYPASTKDLNVFVLEFRDNPPEEGPLHCVESWGFRPLIAIESFNFEKQFGEELGAEPILCLGEHFETGANEVSVLTLVGKARSSRDIPLTRLSDACKFRSFAVIEQFGNC